MPYYRLTSPDDGSNLLVRKASHPNVMHTSGSYIDPAEVEVPFQFEMDVGEPGYDQYDPFVEEEDVVTPTFEERLGDWYSNSSVMSPELVDAIRSRGVDNLQSFPAHIVVEETGEVVDRPYLFVNVVGIVSCAAVGASNATPIGDSFYFHDLVIDETRTHGLLLFRLKEAPFEIIVHETVAEVIEQHGFSGIGVEAIAAIDP